MSVDRFEVDQDRQAVSRSTSAGVSVDSLTSKDDAYTEFLGALLLGVSVDSRR